MDDNDAQIQHTEPASPTDDSEPRPLPLHTPECFGCGSDNSSALRLRPWREGDRIYADIAFDERHIGAPDSHTGAPSPRHATSYSGSPDGLSALRLSPAR